MRPGDLGVLGGPSPVLVITGPSMLAHRGGHDDVPARLHAAWEGIERAARRGAPVVRSEARAATLGELTRVHSPAYIHRLLDACRTGERWFMHPDCPLSPGSEASILFAAGAAAAAAWAVGSGGDGPQRAFCAIRPPGHHAHAERASGFCFVNNAMIAASVLAEGGRRVLVLDLDYHHGDGSASMVGTHRWLAYGSVHADPRRNFPGTGAVRHEPRLVEVPVLTPGGASWRRAVGEVLDGLAAFDPQALVLSFGTDALRGDPVGDLDVDQRDLVMAVRLILDRWPTLPVVSVLEGGYDLEALTVAVESHVLELATPRSA